jgi:hypothetical protein
MLTLSTRRAGSENNICGLQKSNLVDNHSRSAWLVAASLVVNVRAELVSKRLYRWICSCFLRREPGDMDGSLDVDAHTRRVARGYSGKKYCE